MNRFFINRYRSPWSQILVCSPRCTEYIWVSNATDALAYREVRDRSTPYPRSLENTAEYLEIPREALEIVGPFLRADSGSSRDFLNIPEIAAVAYVPARGQDAGPIQIPKTNHKIGVPKNKLP